VGQGDLATETPGSRIWVITSATVRDEVLVLDGVSQRRRRQRTTRHPAAFAAKEAHIGSPSLRAKTWCLAYAGGGHTTFRPLN
jgi:hypothetical protein